MHEQCSQKEKHECSFMAEFSYTQQRQNNWHEIGLAARQWEFIVEVDGYILQAVFGEFSLFAHFLCKVAE